MNTNHDDFGNIDLGDEHDAEHSGGGDAFPEEDEAPPPRSKSRKSSRLLDSRIVRMAALGGIVVLIAGGGYATYSYISSTYFTPAPRHVAHLNLPAPNNAHNAIKPQQMAQADGFPPASGASAGFPSVDQAAAHNLPPVSPLEPEASTEPAQNVAAPAPAFPEAGVSHPASPPAFGSSSVSGAGEHPALTAPAGFPSAAPSIPAAPAPAADQDSMITMLNSNVVKVLSDKADANQTATTNAIKAGTDDVKSDVDTKASEISGQITALQATAAQINARLDSIVENGLKMAAPASAKKDEKAERHAESLHRPSSHRGRVVHPGKDAASGSVKAAQVPTWHLRGFGDGFVVLQKDDRYVPVLIGKPLPDGSGIVEGVGKKDGKSIVRTSTGIIQE